MRQRLRKASLAFCFASIISGGTGLSARQVVAPEKTLRGLPGVNVRVVRSDIANSISDLSQDAIQTDVELKLRLAGITVLRESLAKTPSPILEVNLDMMKDEHDHFSYNIEV